MTTRFFLKALCQPVGIPWIKDGKFNGGRFNEETNLFVAIQDLENPELIILYHNTSIEQSVFKALPYLTNFLKENFEYSSKDPKEVIFYEDHDPLVACIRGVKNTKSKNKQASDALRAIAKAKNIELKSQRPDKVSPELKAEYEEFKDHVGVIFNETFKLRSSPKLG